MVFEALKRLTRAGVKVAASKLVRTPHGEPKGEAARTFTRRVWQGERTLSTAHGLRMRESWVAQRRSVAMVS